MAKLKGPVFSLDARGNIGKTLVFLGWKGLKTVRSYVVPANPRSTGQVTQRNLFTAGVNQWHSTDLTGADKIAWDVYANVLARIMSGFNAFVRQYVNMLVAGKTWALMYGGADTSTTAKQVDFEINTTTGLAVACRYGNAPSSLINSVDMVEDGTTGKYKVSIADLVSGQKLYVQAVVTTTENEGSQTGIYEFIVT